MAGVVGQRYGPRSDETTKTPYSSRSTICLASTSSTVPAAISVACWLRGHTTKITAAMRIAPTTDRAMMSLFTPEIYQWSYGAMEPWRW